MSTAEPLPDTRSPLPESPFTVDALFDLPEDGNRYELLDGSLLVSPAPRFLHQLVVKRMLFALEDAAPSDFEPLDTANLRVGDEDFFIPDIVVPRAETVYDDGLMFRPSDVVLAVETRLEHPFPVEVDPADWVRPRRRR